MSSIRSYLLIAVLSAITLTSFVAALYGYRAGVAAADALFDAELTNAAILISTLLPAEVQASGVKLMRYGGIGVDNHYDGAESPDQYLTLVDNLRTHGHLAAHLDPLGSTTRGDPALEPATLGLTPEAMAVVPARRRASATPGFAARWR